MKKTIFKYPLDLRVGEEQTIQLPRTAKFLKLADQRGTLMTWWELDPSEPGRARKFMFIGTGQPVPHGAAHFETILRTEYIGEAASHCVWHLYEIRSAIGQPGIGAT